MDLFGFEAFSILREETNIDSKGIKIHLKLIKKKN